MLDFIRCPTCGYPIGSIFVAFNKIKSHLLKIELELNKNIINIKNIGVVDHIQLSMKSIFEQLNINCFCCRMHLTSTIDFIDAQNL